MTAPQNERKLYVLTMRSGTSMSRIIHKVTRANLTHSSSALIRGERNFTALPAVKRTASCLRGAYMKTSARA